MLYKTNEIRQLLKDVLRKSKKSHDPAGFRKTYELMEEELGKVQFREEYLYKTIIPKLNRAERENVKEVNFYEACINDLARYLSYNDYDHYIDSLTLSFSERLESCIGSWYSYVRSNSGTSIVYVSPVKIFREEKQIKMLLKGPVRTYTGVVREEAECLYCLLESGQGKNLHLVMKLGLAHTPKVLQGVFSGISSAGDPIAGREILVRRDEPFETMKSRQNTIDEMLRSDNPKAWLVGSYFYTKEDSVLKAGTSSTFDWDDLKVNTTERKSH